MIILKILGVILLIVILLIILSMLLVLFCPVKYRFKGRYKKNGFYRGIIELDYLIKIFKLRIRFADNDPIKIKLSIFGRDIFKKKAKKGKIKKDEIIKVENNNNLDYKNNPIIETKNNEDEKIYFNSVKTNENIKSNKTNIKSNKTKISFGTKLKQIANNIKEKIRNIKETLENTKDIKIIKEKYLTDENILMFRTVKKRVFKLIKHTFPKKSTINGEIGFEDIINTARFFAFISIINPKIIDIDVKPNFQDEVFDITGKIRGKIVIGYILYQGLLLWLDRNFRQLVIRLMRGNDNER